MDGYGRDHQYMIIVFYFLFDEVKQSSCIPQFLSRTCVIGGHGGTKVGPPQLVGLDWTYRGSEMVLICSLQPKREQIAIMTTYQTQ